MTQAILLGLLALPLQAAETAEPIMMPVTDCHADAPPELLQHNADLQGLCDLLNARMSETDTGEASDITLVIETFRPYFIRAHLAWRDGHVSRRGPSIDFGFLDTEFGPLNYGFVVTGLLNASDFAPLDATSP